LFNRGGFFGLEEGDGDTAWDYPPALQLTAIIEGGKNKGGREPLKGLDLRMWNFIF